MSERLQIKTGLNLAVNYFFQKTFLRTNDFLNRSPAGRLATEGEVGGN